MIFTSMRAKLAIAGAALFASGIATAWLLMGHRDDDAADMAGMAQMASAAPAASAGAVVVEIPPELAARAGVVVAEVRTARLPATTRIPATVEPNAYAVVPLIAPAGGRVLRVLPELGDRVAAGAAVAVVQSPDLARAAADQAAAVSALNAIDRDLERTRKLAAIGAASRRELEAREADRADAQARVDAARAEVRLLGGSASRGGEMTVRAASAGVVIAREVNPGVVVERGATLLTTAPLSPVWIIGEVAEADVARVRVGDTASVQTDAYPGLPIGGRVTNIAPEVRRETRTAQIRVEALNPGGRLKFGMLAEVRIEGGGAAATVAIPSAAIQRVGAKTFVYVVEATSGSRFEERGVETGVERDGLVEIRRGLRAGERIVTSGSFHVRAEIERQGLRPVESVAAPAGPRVIPITVDAAAFTPARVTIRQGETVMLRFTRVSESCASDVVIPPDKRKIALPLKQAVDIPFTASRAGEFAFNCGMDMLRGTIVVQ